jgi:hypothetical protein
LYHLTKITILVSSYKGHHTGIILQRSPYWYHLTKDTILVSSYKGHHTGIILQRSPYWYHLTKTSPLTLHCNGERRQKIEIFRLSFHWKLPFWLIMTHLKGDNTMKIKNTSMSEHFQIQYQNRKKSQNGYH